MTIKVIVCHLILALLLSFNLITGSTQSEKKLLNYEPPIVECEQNRDICTFRRLNLPRNQHRFQPFAKNASEIKLIVIENSTIDWFSADLCEYFPNLKEIDIFYAGLQGFDENALLKCRNLESFESTGDKFTAISLSLFYGNRKLRSIAFYGTPIEYIDENQFVEFTELQFLKIVSGRLTHFPVESIRNSKKLIGLYLYGNNLVNFDGEYVLHNFPELRGVAYSDNDMMCSKVRELNELFVYSGVDSYQWLFGRPKPREEETSTHWGVICIADPEVPSTTTEESSTTEASVFAEFH